MNIIRPYSVNSLNIILDVLTFCDQRTDSKISKDYIFEQWQIRIISKKREQNIKKLSKKAHDSNSVNHNTLFWTKVVRLTSVDYMLISVLSMS